jgi:D-serine deaminase-like pyridoxal phosphate-dependent protein
MRSRAHLDGVTELRAGVYVFFDLVMAGIGVCAVDCEPSSRPSLRARLRRG